MSELHETAVALVAPGKGILAADESTGTITRRFAAIGVESTEETRRAYRELLFTTPGAEDFISGVILFDETIRQTAADGTPFPGAACLEGIVPGIKVDRGAKPLALRRGRDGHRGARRAARAVRGVRPLGARFAKWRGVYSIGNGRPERVRGLGQRPCPRALRRARAGGGARADRRARGADGRRPAPMASPAMERGHGAMERGHGEAMEMKQQWKEREEEEKARKTKAR